MYCQYFTSPLGILKLEATAKGLTALQYVSKITNPPNPNQHTQALGNWLTAYFNGQTLPCIIPTDVQGSPFYTKVWSKLSTVPYGTAVTYADLAKAAGSAKAVRAVGTAMRRNPLPIYVPCHRVVKSDGTMGNYTGGVSKKEWLLEFELNRV